MYGDRGYVVVDAEALIFGKHVVVEQIAFVLISSQTGREILAEKHIVHQPFNYLQLANKFRVPMETVIKAIQGYTYITHDMMYIHDDYNTSCPWRAIRGRLQKIFKNRAIKIYAKGKELEQRLLGPKYVVEELSQYDCPKYPYMPHDPLTECRFFAQYIPEIKTKVI